MSHHWVTFIWVYLNGCTVLQSIRGALSLPVTHCNTGRHGNLFISLTVPFLKYAQNVNWPAQLSEILKIWWREKRPSLVPHWLLSPLFSGLVLLRQCCQMWHSHHGNVRKKWKTFPTLSLFNSKREKLAVIEDQHIHARFEGFASVPYRKNLKKEVNMFRIIKIWSRWQVSHLLVPPWVFV